MTASSFGPSLEVRNELVVNAIKVTIVVDPAALARIVVNDQQPEIALLVRTGDDQVFSARMRPRTLRRAQRAIAEADGPVAAILTARLAKNGILLDAGFNVQPRAPKEGG
jgi:hypothetical protein